MLSKLFFFRGSLPCHTSRPVTAFYHRLKSSLKIPHLCVTPCLTIQFCLNDLQSDVRPRFKSGQTSFVRNKISLDSWAHPAVPEISAAKGFGNTFFHRDPKPAMARDPWPWVSNVTWPVTLNQQLCMICDPKLLMICDPRPIKIYRTLKFDEAPTM